MEDYSYLEGKEIKYYYHQYKKNPIDGIVVGCDKDVGITIVRKDNKKKNLVCLNGPSTKYFKENHIDNENYEKTFDIIIDMVISGEYHEDDSIDCLYFGLDPFKTTFSGEMSSCPYSGE